MSTTKAQRQERIRRLFIENWPMKLIAAILVVGFIGGACASKKDEIMAAMDAERKQAQKIKQTELERLKSENTDLKIEISAAAADRANLVTLIEQKDAKIQELEEHIIVSPVPGEIIETRREFVRDKERYPRLPDQANNPGSLRWGDRAKRYGAHAESSKIAIFPDVAHGIAAWIDRVFEYQGVSVRAYIGGGKGVPVDLSYLGPNGDADYYLQVLNQYGVDPDEVITLARPFMIKLIRAHAKAEGFTSEITGDQFTEALQIFQTLSR